MDFSDSWGAFDSNVVGSLFNIVGALILYRESLKLKVVGILKRSWEKCTPKQTMRGG